MTSVKKRHCIHTYLLLYFVQKEILNYIYVNQSLAGQTLAELTDQHSMNSLKRRKEK
jgi:hypothetical protein